MEIMVQTPPRKVQQPVYPATIHTTLYNLIAALSAEVGPDEEAVLTATVVHLLNTHRVTCTGSLQGYRLVCDGVERSARSGQQDDDLASYFETDDEPC